MEFQRKAKEYITMLNTIYKDAPDKETLIKEELADYMKQMNEVSIQLFDHFLEKNKTAYNQPK